jgi:hypothetical protein
MIAIFPLTLELEGPPNGNSRVFVHAELLVEEKLIMNDD